MSGLCSGWKLFWHNLRRHWTHGHVAATTVTDHLDRIDQRNREVRHDLNNVQTRTDALARLIESMREEDIWKRRQKDQSG